MQENETALTTISAMRQKYEDVNGEWPVPRDQLPPLSAPMAKRAFRALYRHRFHRKWTAPVLAVVGKRRRTWTDAGRMIVAPYAGWHRFIHDLSHWAHRRQYPDQKAHKGSSHAAVERDLIKQVVKRGWLEKPVKAKAKAEKPKPDIRALRHARVMAAIKRWETKAKRAATALKKLRRQQAHYERVLN